PSRSPLENALTAPCCSPSAFRTPRPPCRGGAAENSKSPSANRNVSPPPLRGYQGYRGEKSLEEEELRNELGKPLNAIQWVQVPPDQSRAARSVASLAIHRVTGGCGASAARKQATRPQLRNRWRCDAGAVSLAEGSIRQRPLLRGRAGVAGVPSPGHVSKGIAQELTRAPHLLPHQEERLCRVGRYVHPRDDRRGHGWKVEQSYDPIVPVKAGNRRASDKEAATAPAGGKGETSVRIC